MTKNRDPHHGMRRRHVVGVSLIAAIAVVLAGVMVARTMPLGPDAPDPVRVVAATPAPQALAQRLPARDAVPARPAQEATPGTPARLPAPPPPLRDPGPRRSIASIRPAPRAAGTPTRPRVRNRPCPPRRATADGTARGPQHRPAQGRRTGRGA